MNITKSTSAANKARRLSARKKVSRLSDSGVVYPRFSILYKTADGLWRGFVTPYDISYEARSKKKVEEVLPKLTELYEEGLAAHGRPSHLTSVPLSNEEDRAVLDKWMVAVIGGR